MRGLRWVVEDGVAYLRRFRGAMRLGSTLGFVLALSTGLAGCAAQSPAPDNTAAELSQPLVLPASEFAADMVTPAGIRVKTNGQYKTEAERKALALAIDRYWAEVRECAVHLEPGGDTDVNFLIEEFPRELAVEIANNWKVVEGPVSHRTMQAFPSIAHPGSWSTARRHEDDLYILVVPELNGLGQQMVNELNLWINRNANVTPTADLVGACVSVPCLRFNYDNAPSQAWTECKE